MCEETTTLKNNLSYSETIKTIAVDVSDVKEEVQKRIKEVERNINIWNWRFGKRVRR